MKTWTRWMGAAAVVLTLPACVLPLGVLDEDVHVHGSGRLVTEARTVPPFDGVAASGALHVVVVQSGRPGVRVTAEDNLLPYLETRVEGRLLRLGIRHGVGLSPRREMRVEVEAPALAEVHASGAVTLEADVGRTPWLGASASGAARLTLWGFAEQQEVELSGASSYDALELGSREAWLTVSGASQAWVRVTRMLDVDASGASHVWFRGHPAVYARVSGASTVSEY